MPARSEQRNRGDTRAFALCLAVAAVLVAAASAGAQEGTRAPKEMRAIRVQGESPRVDGKLDDPIWARALFVSDFVQKDPNEGQAALEISEVAIVYDDEALYIGARLHRNDPSDILATVSRRDNPGNSERIIVSLDTFGDRRTAYTFAVTATGVRIDYYHPEDQEYSRAYDFNPVWMVRTARTPTGWSAEMRIPFTQLRFRDQEKQVWGVNMNRWVPTRNEDSYWVLVPKNETGWSSRMGRLVGIENIKPSRRLEVTPYVAGNATASSRIPAGDPFHEEFEAQARAGGDLKMGVGPNLTLDVTVNPDFGQVEADPAEVNLTAYETFFTERRPFFTEGSQLLSGGETGFFYSRRIGAPPHGRPEGDFVDVPNSTTILGAAKLTGRLDSGLSVGALGGVTQKEKAQAYDAETGITTEPTVEPTSGYGVLRLQQEFGADASTAGLIMTAVERDVSTESADGDGLQYLLVRRALAGGADWNLRFKGGAYEVDGSLGFSYLQGHEGAIERVQTSSARYFQRPDVSYVSLDTTRTSLAGWVGRLGVEKAAGKHWLWEAEINAESPGFEINDVGRLNAADDIDTYAEIVYRENTPGRVFQAYSVGTSVGGGWNFGRERQYAFLDLGSTWTFRNFMGSFLSVDFSPRAQSDALTRGGPSMGTPASWSAMLSVNNNRQGRLYWQVSTFGGSNENGGWASETTAGVTYRPGDRWEIGITPGYYRAVDDRQYVTTIPGGREETYGSRYLFAFIERSQIVAQARLNLALTPDFTLEFYAEPFAASGRYYDFGELLTPGGRDLRTYGTDSTTITYEGNGSYAVTDGEDSFGFERSDFNVVSFRSNFVLRWEWNPGSTLYLVWQQNRSGFEPHGDRVGVSGLWDSMAAEGDDFFAIKLSYWIPFL